MDFRRNVIRTINTLIQHGNKPTRVRFNSNAVSVFDEMINCVRSDGDYVCGFAGYDIEYIKDDSSDIIVEFVDDVNGITVVQKKW